jgi:putative membrane-bound dehydrogenase-like protein
MILVLIAALQLSPAEAQKAWKVADGLEIGLVASEPDVTDPVAVAFDEDGRLWVAEMADYPLGPPSGRIKRLEDTDGDGRYDRVVLVAKDVATPTGLLPFRGGVLVTAAPDILFIKDGVRETLFSGFVEGNQQHRVNTLVWTIDNWIQGSNGDSGGSILLKDGGKVSINGRDFRFRPDLSGFEPTAGHGQYGNAFDDWGRRFICDNANHLRHPVLPLAYLGRNPWLAVPGVEEGISDHGGACAVFPRSAMQERPNNPGAAGHITSACSISIYRGDALPEEFRGNAFVCEPVHNLVHRDLLVQRGASFTGSRADKDAEFLASSDPWCRPVNLCTGPDGALYVVDMYRAVIEHPQWIPLEMQKRVDLRAGQDKGRIWRIAPKGHPTAKPRRPTVADLAHPNAWWRTTAQRLLLERQDKTAVDALRGLARGPSPLGRLHALWTLEGLGELRAEDVRAALQDPEARLREHGVRLAETRCPEAVAALAGDPDPRVRFQCALSAGPDAAALATILQRDAADKWTRLAALSSAKGLCAKILQRFPKEFFDSPGAIELVRQMADTVGSSREEAQVVEWLRAITADPAPSRWRLAALSALGPPLRRGGLALGDLLAKAGVEKVVAGWSEALAATAFDRAKDPADRTGAIGLLGQLPEASRLETLLQPLEPAEVQAAAVRALGAEAALRLLDGWVRYTAPVRRELLAACFGTSKGPAQILERLEKGMIRPVEIEAHHRDALLKNPSGEFRKRAREALQAKNAEEVEKTIAALYAKVEALAPDLGRGEKVYRTSCATCHRLHGQGFDVGPNLGSIAGRDKRSLLTDLLDPNRAVAPQFQVYLVKTASGELLSGIVAAETPAGLTLRRPNGEESAVQRRDIAEIKAWPASLMPEGLENSLSAQDFADLLEYLRRGKVN